MDKTKIALQIITILVGISILVILIQGDIEKTRKIERMEVNIASIANQLQIDIIEVEEYN